MKTVIIQVFDSEIAGMMLPHLNTTARVLLGAYDKR